MAINENYKDKAEWQRGYDIGHNGVVKALDETVNKTKQGYYIATRTFNKKMAEEHVTQNMKSDDFLAGMETAIQREFQKRWESAPVEQPTVFSVMGMEGLVGVHIPSGIPPANPNTGQSTQPNPAPKKEHKSEGLKNKGRFEFDPSDLL
jgi:hypothetical protein